MGRIKKNVLKYGKKELNSSVSVFLDLTEPKRNETTEIPKFTEIVLFRSSTVMGDRLEGELILPPNKGIRARETGRC